MSRLQSIEEQNDEGHEWRLMISGVLTLDGPPSVPAMVERGMPILSRERQEVGKVAAVRVDESANVEAVLLSRLPAKMEYCIIPVACIVTVCDQQLILDLDAGTIDTLEKWK